MLKSIDPATGRELVTFEEADEKAVESAIAKAWEVRHGWRDAGVEHRSQLLRAVAGVLRADKARYASILTAEMGKPIVEAEGEVEKCAWTAGWIADNAARLLAAEPMDRTASRSYVRYQPLGIVLAVMPWNFPFWQAFRAGLPALAAGNVMLLKHASNVPQAALGSHRTRGARRRVHALYVESPGVAAEFDESGLAARGAHRDEIPALEQQSWFH